MLFKAKTCSPDEIAKPVTNERELAASHCCFSWLALLPVIPLKDFGSQLGSEDPSAFPGSILIRVKALEAGLSFQFHFLNVHYSEAIIPFPGGRQEQWHSSRIIDRHWKPNLIFICHKTLFFRGWRDGSAVKSPWLFLQRTGVEFTRSRWHTMICNSRSRRSNTLF